MGTRLRRSVHAAERCGVECLEELRFGADIGWFGRDELGVGDDRVAIGRVELVPVLPSFEFGDRLVLGGGELYGAAGGLVAKRGGELREQGRETGRGRPGAGDHLDRRDGRSHLFGDGRPSAWRSRRCRSCHSRSRFSRCWSATRQLSQIGAEAVVVIGDGAEALVPAKRYKRVDVIGVRRLWQWRFTPGAAGEVL